jgi:hypothetical protein
LLYLIFTGVHLALFDARGEWANFLGTLASTFAIAIVGWLIRRVRKYLVALQYANQDISTIWLKLKLPRKLRSGSYARPRYGENEDY